MARQYSPKSTRSAAFKRVLVNVLLASGSLILALGLMELVLPLLHVFSIDEAVYQVRRPVVQYIYGAFHPELRYTLEKNMRNVRLHYPGKLDYTVSTNSQGFRGPEWDLSPARRNVVLLGDSFGFGWGVAWDETAGRLLEQRLQAIDPRFQVINLATSGYSIKEVVRCYELYGKRFNPEMVIYVFCPNDLESISPPVAPGVYDLDYHPQPGDAEAFARMRERNQPGYWSWDKFRRGSYLHAFYARYVRPILSRRIRLSLHHDVSPAGYDYPPPLPATTEHPDDAENRFLLYCLSRLQRQVNGHLLITTTSDKTILVRKDDAQNLRWILARYCREHDKATFVDFEDMARRTPDGHKLYFKYDDHWTPEGHRAAADLLFAAMRRNGLTRK